MEGAVLKVSRLRPASWSIKKSRFWAVATVAILLIFALTACVGAPTEPNWAELSVLDGNLFVAFSHNLVMLEPNDGSFVNLYNEQGNLRTADNGDPLTWNVSVSGQNMRFYTDPLVTSENTLLALSYDRKLFEIEIDAARLQDSAGRDIAGHTVANAVVDGTRMYVPLTEKDLIAYDVETLDVLWRFETERGVWASPLLVDGILYVASMDHSLYAVNAETGALIWERALEGALAATPTLYNDHLYVGSFARRIYQISLDGEVVQNYATNEWVWSSPVIVDDTLYTADLGGWVYALDLSDGQMRELWKRQAATRAIRPSPLVTQDHVVVGSRDHFVYWLDRATGETVVRHEVPAEILAELLLLEPSETINIAEPLVIVATQARDNLVFAFPADGNSQPSWKFPR